MTDKKLTQLSTGSAIVDADLFYSAPQAGGQVKQPASALRTYLLGGSGIRTLLTASLNIYIDPAGNDTTGTGAIGAPWQTIQKAFDYCSTLVDMGGFGVYINMAAGTYTGRSNLLSPGSVGFLGVNLVANGNVLLTATDETVLYTYFSYLTIGGGSGIFTITNNQAGGYGIWADTQSYLLVTAPVHFTAGATSTIHFYAQLSGALEIDTTDITITGNFDKHILASRGGAVATYGYPVTLVSTPTVSTAFAVATQNGNVTINSGASFTGSLTGKKYQATMNGTIETFSQTLPGSVAGTTATGGQEE